MVKKKKVKNKIMDNVVKRRDATAEEKVVLLQNALEAIFDGKVEITYYHEDFTEFVIKDIHWYEDLIGVLGRLRERFWIELDTDSWCEKDEDKKWCISLSLPKVELTPRNELSWEKK